MGLYVNYARSFTPKERNQLVVQRLNNNQLILLSQQKGLFFARKHIKEIQL